MTVWYVTVLLAGFFTAVVVGVTLLVAEAGTGAAILLVADGAGEVEAVSGVEVVMVV